MSFFQNEFLTTPKNNEIEVTILGTGYGESIILFIPGVGWGIIDSFSTKIKTNTVVPALEYLKGILPQQDRRIAFIALTHPHEDHYRGLDRILENFLGVTERVCWYSGNGTNELKQYLAFQKATGGRSLVGYPRVLTSIQNSIKNGAQLRRLSELTEIIPNRRIDIEDYGSTNVSLVSLSPSALNIQKYTEILLGAYPVPGRTLKPIEDREHNLISVAMLLKIGNVQMVFGSDVETYPNTNMGWNAIITNRDFPDLSADLVKVAHHGSENGVNVSAWRKHASNKKPIAILTPFIRGNTILPSEKGTNDLKKYTEKIGITSKIEFETNLYDYYSRNTVERGIKRKTRGFKIIKPIDRIGFIRTRMLLDGTIIENTAVPPAYWIK